MVAICSPRPATDITPVVMVVNVVAFVVVVVVSVVVAVVVVVVVNDVVSAICSSHLALCGSGSNMQIATHKYYHCCVCMLLLMMRRCLRYAVRALPSVAGVAICISRPTHVIVDIGAFVFVPDVVVVVVAAVVVNVVVSAICSLRIALCGNGSNMHSATHNCSHVCWCMYCCCCGGICIVVVCVVIYIQYCHRRHICRR